MGYVESNLKFTAQVPDDGDATNQEQLAKRTAEAFAWEVNDLVGGAFDDELRGDNEPTEIRVLTPEEVVEHEKDHNAADDFDDREEPFDD